MGKPLPPKYKTTNWFAYHQSFKQLGQLLLWLELAGSCHSQAGTSANFSDAAIQFSPFHSLWSGVKLPAGTG
ncbi:hypothetical protein LH460_09300 [Laribacter hongkongensis]|nr:hypothetical protein [Laribacter hongkongensis]